MPDNALTDDQKNNNLSDYQKKYYLGIFHKMMDALKEHGDRSKESEKYRKMLAPIMRKENQFYEYLLENI